MSSATPVSTYVVARDPNKYGGRQADYVCQVQTVIQGAAARFQQATAGQLDLEALFHATLASFGEERQRIAVAHGTKNADHFGTRRDRPDVVSRGVFGFTPLITPYDSYEDPLIDLIGQHLNRMRSPNGEFRETKRVIQGGPCLGRASSMEIEILPHDAVSKWSFSDSLEECQRLCALCDIAPPQNTSEVGVAFDRLINNFDNLRLLKQRSLVDYKRIRASRLTSSAKEFFDTHWSHELRDHLQGKKVDWVFVTLRSEVDGKMYALSHYLTWLHRDCGAQEDPVTHMHRCSHVTVVHQDCFLTELMLADIAKVFKQALEWDGKALKTLKERVALLEYEFAHAMPMIRGSAAIGEWLEMAIYRYHGYNVTYTPDKMVNLEALCSPLSTFVASYSSMIHLEKA